MIRGVTIKCLFTLKMPKTTYLISRRILVSGLRGIFSCIFEAMDWFNKVFRVFSRCFRYIKKRSENEFLWEKTTTLFFWSTSWWILKSSRQHVGFFFSQIIGVDNMLYVPINLRKNRRSRAVLLGQALDLASFFFNFIFFY